MGFDTEESSDKDRKRQGMSVKVYLVLLRSNVVDRKPLHDRILAGCLTRAAAEEIRAMNPGSYIHKIFATK